MINHNSKNPNPFGSSSIKGQRSGSICVSCALLHIAIVIVLLIGFDVWFVWSVWFKG